jgi:hypothetical protein
VGANVFKIVGSANYRQELRSFHMDKEGVDNVHV